MAELKEQTSSAGDEAVVAVVGNPAVTGLPSFVVGSVALGLALTGFVPAAAAGASIPIIATATGFGLLGSAIWAAWLSQNAVASVFAVFSGFWLSYAGLVLGLTHNWFGIKAADAVKTQELFLLTWLLLIVVVTLASLRLPLAFTVLLGLVDIALLLLLLGTDNASTSLTKAAGYVVLAFALLGAYLFLGAMSAATGGKALPAGRPIIR